MKVWRPVRSAWDSLLAIGEYPEETDVQRGRRRIVVGYMAVGIPPRVFFAASEFSEGLTALGWIDVIAAVVPAVGLVALRARPHSYIGVVNVLLAALVLENLLGTIIVGGLSSSLLLVFGLVVVVGALIALDRTSAFWWFLVYIASVVLSVMAPQWIEPLYQVEGSDAEDASIIITTAILLYAGMAYFVHQRDRFQQESDDLLHNILPDEIATRLKGERGMIADEYPAASVLFADVVGFTPMSANMSPKQLVGLLNTVFSTFDGFVTDLGLEKIKTVGDEYMVASGVPTPRSDHARAIAKRGLRSRDQVAAHQIEGHQISQRIGIK
jgi:adenylate cyclase